MNYLQFDFETEEVDQMDQLVALLNDQGFEGFEEENNCLKAYIAENKFDAPGFSSVLDRFSHISYTQTTVEHINWNKKWEEEFKPVLVDNFVGIRAGFHHPLKNVEHEIIITPKMSFGTGHHATTYLMISQMQSIDFKGKTVLDFGTGTGVLAILAEKSGAEKILAIDYDEWSITNTKENIDANGCFIIDVQTMEAVPALKFDIILANINLNVIMGNLNAIKNASNPAATILLSGFLKDNEEVMKSSLHEVGLEYLSTAQKGDWIAILAKNSA